METNQLLQEILNEIKKLAFKQIQQLQKIVMELQALSEQIEHAPEQERLELILKWLQVASSIRPADFKGIGKYMAECLRTGKPIPEQLKIALKNFNKIPPPAARQEIMETEHKIAEGDYDWCISETGKAKYAAAQQEKLNDQELKKDVDDFHARNKKFCSQADVRRRPMWKERGYAPENSDFTGTDKDLVLLDLTSLCYAHNLFGLGDRGKTPLLEKLSVWVTPFTVNISIPLYWPLDPKRDFNWKEILKLLKCWDYKRQGAKWDRATQYEKFRLAYEAKLEGRKEGRTGAALDAYIIKMAGLNENIDEANLRRCVRIGKRLCKGGAKAE